MSKRLGGIIGCKYKGCWCWVLVLVFGGGVSVGACYGHRLQIQRMLVLGVGFGVR